MPTLDRFLADIGAAQLSTAVTLRPPGAPSHGPAAALHARLDDEITHTNDRTLALLKDNWDDLAGQLKHGDDLIRELEDEENELKALEQVVDGPDAFLPPLVAHLEEQQSLAASHLLSTASVALLSALLTFHTTTATLASATTAGNLVSAVEALRSVTAAVEEGAEEWIEQTEVWKVLVRWAGEEESRLEAALQSALEGCFELDYASASNEHTATLTLRERIAAAPDGPLLAVDELISALEELASITGRKDQVEPFLARLAKQVLRHFVAPFLEANGKLRDPQAEHPDEAVASATKPRLAFKLREAQEQGSTHVVSLAPAGEGADEQDTVAALSSYLAFFTAHSSLFPRAGTRDQPSKHAATLTAHLTPSLQSYLISSHLAPSLPSSTASLAWYQTLLASASEFEASFLAQHHLFAFLPAALSTPQQQQHQHREVEEQRVVRSWAARVPLHWARTVGDQALARVRAAVKAWDWGEGEHVEVDVREEDEMLGLFLGLGMGDDLRAGEGEGVGVGTPRADRETERFTRELVLQTVPRGAKREMTMEEATAPKAPRPRSPPPPPPPAPAPVPAPVDEPAATAPAPAPPPAKGGKRGKLGAARIAAPLEPRSPSPPPLFQGNDAPPPSPPSSSSAPTAPVPSAPPAHSPQALDPASIAVPSAAAQTTDVFAPLEDPSRVPAREIGSTADVARERGVEVREGVHVYRAGVEEERGREESPEEERGEGRVLIKEEEGDEVLPPAHEPEAAQESLQEEDEDVKPRAIKEESVEPELAPPSRPVPVPDPAPAASSPSPSLGLSFDDEPPHIKQEDDEDVQAHENPYVLHEVDEEQNADVLHAQEPPSDPYAPPPPAAADERDPYAPQEASSARDAHAPSPQDAAHDPYASPATAESHDPHAPFATHDSHDSYEASAQEEAHDPYAPPVRDEAYEAYAPSAPSDAHDPYAPAAASEAHDPSAPSASHEPDAPAEERSYDEPQEPAAPSEDASQDRCAPSHHTSQPSHNFHSRDPYAPPAPAQDDSDPYAPHSPYPSHCLQPYEPYEQANDEQQYEQHDHQQQQHYEPQQYEPQQYEPHQHDAPEEPYAPVEAAYDSEQGDSEPYTVDEQGAGETYDPEAVAADPYAPHDYATDAYPAEHGKSEPYDPEQGDSDPYAPLADDQQQPSSSSPEQQYDRYAPEERAQDFAPEAAHGEAEQPHDPYAPVEPQHDPYAPAEPQHSPYAPAEQQYGSQVEGEQAYDPYAPTEEHFDPYADGHDFYATEEQNFDPYAAHQPAYEAGPSNNQSQSPVVAQEEPQTAAHDPYAPVGQPASQSEIHAQQSYDPSAVSHDPYAPSTAADSHDQYGPAHDSHDPYAPAHEARSPYDPYAPSHESYDPYAPSSEEPGAPQTSHAEEPAASESHDYYSPAVNYYPQESTPAPPTSEAASNLAAVPPPPRAVGGVPPPPLASSSTTAAARTRGAAKKRQIYVPSMDTPAAANPAQHLATDVPTPSNVVSPPPSSFEAQQAAYVPLQTRSAAVSPQPYTPPLVPVRSSSTGLTRSLPGRPSSRQDGPILNHIQQRFVSPPPSAVNPYVPLANPPAAPQTMTPGGTYIPANDPLFADLFGGAGGAAKASPSTFFKADPPAQRSSSNPSLNSPNASYAPAHTGGPYGQAAGPSYGQQQHAYQPQQYQPQQYQPQQYQPQQYGQYGGYGTQEEVEELQDRYAPAYDAQQAQYSYGYEQPAMRMRGGGGLALSDDDEEDDEDENEDEDECRPVLRIRGGADLGEMDDDDGNRSADDWGFGDDAGGDGDDDGWGFGEDDAAPPTPPSPAPAPAAAKPPPAAPAPAPPSASTFATPPRTASHAPSASVTSVTSSSGSRSRPPSYAFSPSLAPPPLPSLDLGADVPEEEAGDDAWGFADEDEPAAPPSPVPPADAHRPPTPPPAPAADATASTEPVPASPQPLPDLPVAPPPEHEAAPSPIVGAAPEPEAADDDWGFGQDADAEDEAGEAGFEVSVVPEEPGDLLEYEKAVQQSATVTASPPLPALADEVVGEEETPAREGAFAGEAATPQINEPAVESAATGPEDDGWDLEEPTFSPVEGHAAPPDARPFAVEEQEEPQRIDEQPPTAAPEPAADPQEDLELSAFPLDHPSSPPDMEHALEAEPATLTAGKPNGPAKERRRSVAIDQAEPSALNLPAQEIEQEFPDVPDVSDPVLPLAAQPLPHSDSREAHVETPSTEASLQDIAAEQIDDAAQLFSNDQGVDAWGLGGEDHSPDTPAPPLATAESFSGEAQKAEALDKDLPAATSLLDPQPVTSDFDDFEDFTPAQPQTPVPKQEWEPFEEPGDEPISSLPPDTQKKNDFEDDEELEGLATRAEDRASAESHAAAQPSSGEPSDEGSGVVVSREGAMSSPEVVEHSDAWDFDGEAEGAEVLGAADPASEEVTESIVQHESERPDTHDESSVQHEEARPIVDDAIAVPGLLLAAQDAHPQQRTFSPPPDMVPAGDDSTAEAAWGWHDDEGGAELLQDDRAPDHEQGAIPVPGESAVQHEDERIVTDSAEVTEPLPTDFAPPQGHTLSPPPSSDDVNHEHGLNLDDQEGAEALYDEPPLDVEQAAPPADDDSTVQHEAERPVLPALPTDGEPLAAELAQPQLHTISPPPSALPSDAFVEQQHDAALDEGFDDPWDLEPVEPHPTSPARADNDKTLPAVTDSSGIDQDQQPSTNSTGVVESAFEGSQAAKAEHDLGLDEPLGEPAVEDVASRSPGEVPVSQHADHPAVARADDFPAAQAPPQQHAFEPARADVRTEESPSVSRRASAGAEPSPADEEGEWGWDADADVDAGADADADPAGKASSTSATAPVPAFEAPTLSPAPSLDSPQASTPAPALPPAPAPAPAPVPAATRAVPPAADAPHSTTAISTPVAQPPSPSPGPDHSRTISRDEWAWEADKEEEQSSAPPVAAELKTGSDESAAEEAPAKSSPPPVRREQMMVSKRSREIVTIAEEILLEALQVASPSFKHPEFSAAAAPLLQTFISLLSLYRATAAVHNSRLLASVPAIGMQFANDAEWIGREVERVWRTATEDKELQVAKDQADEVELAIQSTRQLGRDTRQKQIAIQRAALMESLDEANGFMRTSDDNRYSACERALQQVTHTLQRLALVWKPVMTPTALYTSIGGLVNEVLLRVLDEIEAQADISEEESIRLNKLCKMLHELESLFDGSETTVGREVPTWWKFNFLSELLEASMADIMFLFEHGHLVDFAPQEIVSLVRALFADSSLRNQNIEKILRGHPTAPPEEEEWGGFE